MNINSNFFNLKDNYLFSTISQKVSEFKSSHKNQKLINLGIGDTTEPLCRLAISEMHKAVDEMSSKTTFKGYGPEQGYEFLRQIIKSHYSKRNVDIDISEIFISDGAKSDLGNILDIFDVKNNVLISDPVYPVYVDSNIMDGRKISYIDANEDNLFLPLPLKDEKADIIYLCSPNNPTGATYNHEQLASWVDYAVNNNAIIIFDAAYEAFVDDENLPHSIFEIEGAKKCAIEICSFSKTAGFTGTRCGYTVIPQDLKFDNARINEIWLRRQATKFNGVSYIVQRGAAAVFSDEGAIQIRKTINYYKENANIISKTFKNLNIWFTGGKNSPYVWFKCPNDMSSWEFFDYLLSEAHTIGTPGIGFGRNGEGFFRFSAFADRSQILESMELISQKIF